MKLYRLYTENKNVEGIKEIINAYFSGYTLIEGVGIWNGISEKSLIVEVVNFTGKSNLEAEFKLIAGAIKKLNCQDAVLLTVQEIESKFVEEGIYGL